MKKLLALLLSATLAISMLTACGSSETPTEEKTEEGGEEAAEGETPVLELTIAHSSAGGTWNTIAEGLAEVLRNEYPGSSISVIPGSGEGNIAQLHAGEVDLALTTSADAKDAMLGVEHFDEPITDVKALCSLFSPVVQIFVNADCPIDSVDDLIEQQYPIKISVHSQGSGIEIAARRVFEAYGISYDDIKAWGGTVEFIGTQDAAEMMGNGQLDAYFGFSTCPINNFKELEVTHDFKVLGLRDDVIAAMTADWEYPAGVIPAGTYECVAEDIPSITETTGLYASANLDDETCYYVMKAILNHIDELGNIHSRLDGLTADYMQADTVFPMSDGAAKAYAE